MPTAPGTYVSSGAKSEWGVKLRGLGTNRITLLYDGIPVYEPYYNSFDVKAFTADQVDSIKVVKGASSILYGPNTMGGIVDVLSKRPDNQPVHAAPGLRHPQDLRRLCQRRPARQEHPVHRLGFPRSLRRLQLGERRRDRTAPEQRLRAHQPGRKTVFLPRRQRRDHGRGQLLPIRVRHPHGHGFLQEAVLALQGLAAPDGQPGRQLSHLRRRLRQGPAVLRQALQRPRRLQERPVQRRCSGNRPTTTTPWALSSWAWCPWAKRTSCRPASPIATTTSAPSPI